MVFRLVLRILCSWNVCLVVRCSVLILYLFVSLFMIRYKWLGMILEGFLVLSINWQVFLLGFWSLWLFCWQFLWNLMSCMVFLLMFGVFVVRFFFKGWCRKLLFCLMILILFCFGGIVVGGFMGCVIVIYGFKIQFLVFVVCLKFRLND